MYSFVAKELPFANNQQPATNNQRLTVWDIATLLWIMDLERLRRTVQELTPGRHFAYCTQHQVFIYKYWSAQHALTLGMGEQISTT